MVGINVLEEAAVHVVRLLLDDGAELHQLVRNGLVGALENVDEAVELLLAPHFKRGSTRVTERLLTIQSAPCLGR